MPTVIPHIKARKSIKSMNSVVSDFSDHIDIKVAEVALVKGLRHLKSRLGWSGTKIASILHLPANTLNNWLEKGRIPIGSKALHPDIQAIIHLLAIHRSLEAMFAEPEHQVAWLVTVHPEIDAIPEKLMGESIEGLIFVRQYLDYVRGRGA